MAQPVLVGKRVRWRRAVRLICAGWVPQDGVRLERTACLQSSVAPQQEPRAAAHSCIAGRSTRYLPGPPAGRLVGAGDLSGGGPAHLLIHHGQGPAPPGQLPCDSHVSDRGALLPFKHPRPAVVQSAVAGIATGPSRSRGQVPAILHDLADAVCPAVVPGCVNQQPPAWVLPVLVIGLRTLLVPEECSQGTSPTKAPMVLPVKRCQSPISTASPKPVSVEIPRKHPSQWTTSVNWDSVAIWVIA